MGDHVTYTGNMGYGNNIFDGKPHCKQILGSHKQYRRDGEKAGKNYLGPKGQ